MRLISFCALAVAAFLTFVSCTQQPAQPDPRLSLLEAQTLSLMTAEAEDGFMGIWKTKFDPAKARLVVGSELHDWLQKAGKPAEKLPEPFKTTIPQGKEIGLLISDGFTGKDGKTHAVMYLRTPHFGSHRRFVIGEWDPCGDGIPATCDFCTGCEGETDIGTIHSCLCTETCGSCQVCPSC